MVTNLKKLSDALDKAVQPAPAAGSELVAAIRADEARIESDLTRSGVSYVKTAGVTFKVVRATGAGGVLTKVE
jgi:hypothetical protein